ncbi:DUF397 domain-containing protein [Nocardia niigatensis]|uniref:DUF397 domain-containing protein n=1 Tax=Nocardia niigatensis TaxID=209249 RepID=UPI000685D378|nr:DUF397 domain-containing protein [Nocardia niigatensis]
MSAIESGRIITDAWLGSSWFNTSRSCVEVRLCGPAVLIRGSKYLREPASDPAAQPIICVSGAEWDAFLGRARAGVFDL